MNDIEKGREVVRWFREGKRPTMEMMKRVWLNEWDMEGELLAYISALEAVAEAAREAKEMICESPDGICNMNGVECHICQEVHAEVFVICQALSTLGKR